MVIFCKSFVIDDVADGGMRKKKAADERQSTKIGSKNNATDGRNKKNVPVVAKEPKVAPVEPMAKVVKASDGTRTKGRADHDHGASAIAPAPPHGTDIPLAKHSATSQPPPSPLLPQAVNQMVQWPDSNPDDYKQLLDSSPSLQARSKVSSLQLVKGSGGNDHNSKKLLDKLDSWLRKRERNDLKSTSVLVLKMTLHCEGCVRKIRQALKKFGGVEDFAFDADRDLVAVLGAVNEEKLVWHLERDLKKEITVVLSAKTTNNKEAAVPAADGRNKKKPDVAVHKRSSKKAKEGAAGTGQEVDPLTPPVAVKTDEKKTKPRCSPAVSAGAGGEGEPDRADMDMPLVRETTSTLNLRIKVHCDGCIEKIREAIKQFKEAVDSVDLQVSSDLVTVMVAVEGRVDMRDLILYLSNILKHEVEVEVTRKSTGAPVDEKHCIKPPVDLENKYKKGHPVASCAGIQGCVKRITPATPLPIYVKDINGRASESVPVTNNPSSYGVHYYGNSGANRLLPQNLGTFMGNLDMFNEENPHACSIM
ncbi:hypothetical protein CDL15_Pgr002003 [Punica granatum]|uniref:HMA domain-containing protein n=1 Tax=Punica granatum TaxID=22663 RepID=A0A218XCL1_PUNGR|nr:hypothetical protein CDL15_Pgr002003 [Punica granatum]